MIDTVKLGLLEFVHEGTEMFVNRLADPDGVDGEHVATAEGIWPEVWASFVQATGSTDMPIALMTDAEKVARYEETLRWVLNFPRTLDTAVREKVRIALEGEEVLARKVVHWPRHGHMLAGDTQLLVYEDEVPQLEADSMLFGSVFTRLNKDGVCERLDPNRVSGEYRL